MYSIMTNRKLRLVPAVVANQQRNMSILSIDQHQITQSVKEHEMKETSLDYFWLTISFFFNETFSLQPFAFLVTFWRGNVQNISTLLAIPLERTVRVRRVAEVFGGVFVLTGIFIKGAFKYERRRREPLGGSGGMPPHKARKCCVQHCASQCFKLDGV